MTTILADSKQQDDAPLQAQAFDDSEAEGLTPLVDVEASPADRALQDAALAVPDSDALSVSSLQTLPHDHEQLQAADEESIADASDTRHQLDWAHMLGLSGQSLNAATTATSFGFAAARSTTAFGLNVAKRFTQGLVALPAMALDGAVTGTSPGSGSDTPTMAQVAHAAVGGVFDVISTLALGGIDVGSAITGASLGAAASGVEGVRRALGSEVLKSLGAFSRLVKREWNSVSDTLPPGGIPGYSVLGVTQALTAWVCIQMVTREYYEAKMLRHLEPIDLEQLHRLVEKERKAEESRQEQASQGEEGAKLQAEEDKAHREDTPGASSKAVDRKQKKQVRILDQQHLPAGEGDLIGAEIGRREQPASAQAAGESPKSALVEATSRPPPAARSSLRPLTNQEAIQGLKRYSKLVLGVYGGVALAWLGSLPPDLMQAAGSVVDGQAPTVTKTATSSRPEPLLSHSGRRSAALDDESDFLRAAASLDLDEGELIEDELGEEGVLVETGGTASPSGMPGAFDHVSKVKAVEAASIPNTVTGISQGTAEVLFSQDGDEPRLNAQITHAPNAATTGTAAAQKTSSYSYIDILTGQADADLFHRLGGLEDGAALEGNYDESSSQAGSAQERLRKKERKVALPSQPRYYVVTDHGNKKIILVLRGSLSLGDIAIDLTCESANFEVNSEDQEDVAPTTMFLDEEGPEPAQDFSEEAIKERQAKTMAEAEAKQNKPQSRPHERGEYIVHEGMYETAKEIGGPGRPVHRAVRNALLSNPGYNLDIAGHSLGAGVASLLAIMWADTETCLTVKKSGLPPGRRTHAFCFAVPCVMGNKLGKKAEKLVTSYCYSYDLVCRLSLGAILDIRNACAWLAYENAQPSDGTSTPSSSSSTTPSGLAHPIRLTNIMQRAFQHQSGRLDATSRVKNELEADFLALRKTLEANMQHVELYPPGVVLYSLDKTDLEPLSSQHTSTSNLSSRNQYLYRLNDDANRADVFGQIIFSRGMLSKHMPHLYHDALDGL